MSHGACARAHFSFLIRHAGKVVTYRQLLKEVWGPLHVEEGHYQRAYMRQLRLPKSASLSLMSFSARAIPSSLRV